jgi:hypothetical protein
MVALCFLTACTPALQANLPPAAASQPAATLTSPPTITATASPSATSTVTPSATPSLTFTPTSTPTATPTPLPTYIKLRGEVLPDQVVCHYGPGKPYLYKYGVIKGNRLEVIRRVSGSDYVEVQAIGGDNPCWVKLEYLKLNGDWLNLQPVAADQVVLPLSPYYGPPAWVKAERTGDDVLVTYSGIKISPGKDSLQTPYIVEAWVCQGGQQVFIPAGSWGFSVTIRDEPGCTEPSHGRLLAAEKHGYTTPVVIDWPQPEKKPAQ